MEALIGFPSVTSVTAINSYQSGTVIQGFIPSGRVHKYLPDMKQGSDYSLFNFYGSKSKPFGFHSYEDFEDNCDLKGDLHDVVGHMNLVNGQTFIEHPILDEVEIATHCVFLFIYNHMTSCSLLLLVGLLIDAYVSHYNDNSLKNLQSGMQAWSNNITKLIATLTGYTYLFMFLVVVSPNGKRMHMEQEGPSLGQKFCLEGFEHVNQLEALNLTLTIIENLELREWFCCSPLYFNWRQNIISDFSGNVYSNDEHMLNASQQQQLEDRSG
ncbi:hypothetical protein DY000_02016865 [Brassica cretica]|uniref:Uncharacterized protein n=1 Tax=Brassica cretica TaxID=69181 RepID=A0ABQ7CWQ3_BRACR|nr:hypothetical protein DY000_02016865 [Brassica cretica]